MLLYLSEHAHFLTVAKNIAITFKLTDCIFKKIYITITHIEVALYDQL